MSLGNAVVDVVAAVPALPRRGEDVVGSGGPEAGGSGLRALLAVRAAGVDAAFAGRIGAGPLGKLVRSALARAGVPVMLAPVPTEDTGVAVTLVEPDGERSFVTVPGAETADPALGRLRIDRTDLLHVSGYGLQHPDRAAAIGRFLTAVPDEVPVLLDPGPLGGVLPGAAAARIDWWSGTGAEATAETGIADPARAAAALARRVRRGAVVRLGAAGCLLAAGGRAPARVPAPRVTVRTTNGAGDTHVGAFLAALARGAEPLAAARAATEAAAAFVAR
ncbi:MAG: PfkB family carbohydrate kinase [Amnibacterium sp.]